MDRYTWLLRLRGALIVFLSLGVVSWGVLVVAPLSVEAAPSSTCTVHSPWTVFPSPNVGTSNNVLSGVAGVSSKNVWAVGNTTSPQPLIEQWNGTSWSFVSNPIPGSGGFFTSVAAVSSTDAWAVGNASGIGTAMLTEHWNGTSWSIVPNPGSTSGGILYSVSAVASNDVWTVGTVGGFPSNQTFIEHWDGSSWSIVSSPNVPGVTNALYGVVARATNDVWAVGGSATTDGLNSSTLVEHWDGTSWSIVSSPNTGSGDVLRAITAVPKSNILWAAGFSNTSVGSPDHLTLIEKWNGTKWSIVSSPNTSAASNLFYGVAAGSKSNVWAVGQTGGGSTPLGQALIEHWNGSSWSVISNSIPAQSFFYGISKVPGGFWAVGGYVNTSGVQQTLTAFHC